MLPSKFLCHVIGFVWSVVLGALIVAAGGSTEPASPTTENAGIQACRRVHNATSVSKDAIWCIGKLSKTMIVVTRGRMVFEMPLDALNRTIDKFYLGNYAPVPLEKKWPVLVHYQHYQDVKDILFGCLPVRDVDSDYLLFATWNGTDKSRKGGLTLDLTKNAIFQGKFGSNWILDEPDSKIRWISSGGLAGYYRLTTEPNGGVAVRLLHFCYKKPLPHNSSRDFWPGKPCNKFRECEMIMPSCDWDDQAIYPLCKDGEDGLHVVQKKDAQCTSITWEVWNGFVDSGKFYLFGKNFVFTFSEEAYNKPGTRVTVRKIPFGDFIQCGGNPNARDMELTKKSPVAFGLIVAIILIIVLCCLCILLCLMREAMARRKKKRKGKSGGSSKPFFPATRRSTGLPGFGALSRKLSGGSKRSKGPPSSAKKLSRKGPGSKRSLLNSKPGSLKPKGIPGTRRSAGASGAGQPLTRRSIGATRRSSNNSRGGLLTRAQSAGRYGNPATNRSSKFAQRGSRKGSRKSRGSSGASNRATERSKLRK